MSTNTLSDASFEKDCETAGASSLGSVKAILAAFPLDSHILRAKGGAVHVIFPATKEKLVIGMGSVVENNSQCRVTLYGVDDDPRTLLAAPALPAWQNDEDVNYRVLGCLHGPHLDKLLCSVLSNMRANRKR